jgi:hypothetical protein
MEEGARVDRKKHKERLDTLPAELVEECKRIAEDVRVNNENVRDDKILTARVRMCSGYYDSEHVLCMIAARLLSEGTAEPDCFLAG